MYELIISAKKTGQVRRWTFETREEARAFEADYFRPKGLSQRDRDNYRVEVNWVAPTAARPKAA